MTESAGADRGVETGPAFPRMDGLPLVGVLFPLRRDALQFFSKAFAEHGDRVELNVLGRTALLLRHPDDMEAVFMTDRNSFGRSVEIRNLRPIFGDGLLVSEGELWQNQRRMIQPSFAHGAIGGYMAMMQKCIARQAGEWREGESREAHREMMQYTREVICRALFGDEFAADHHELAEAVTVVFGELRSEILYLPVWRKLPLARSRRWNRAVKVLNEAIRGIIRNRRENGEDRSDLLGALLSGRDASGQAMSDQQVHDELLTFFLAGHETSALALTWALYLLAAHPAVQEKAAEEAQGIEDCDGNAPELARSPYLRAVVQEALRLYPPVWSVGRETTAETSLDGVRVRKGTHVWLCIQQLHRDARWYREPDRFDPERWMREDPPQRYTYAPFGLGPRMCIGQHFATAEAVIGVAEILRRFRLHFEGPPPEPDAWITMRPKTAIRIGLQTR